MLEEMQAAKARNDANNANTIRNAAAVAKNTGHPVASAIGTGVEIADKISGGKASEKLGKAMTLANKFTPGGKSLQRLSNLSAETGIGDRLGSAMRAKNGNLSSQAKPAANGNQMNKKSNIPSKGKTDLTTKNTINNETDESGSFNFSLTKKLLVRVAIASVPFFAVIIFCCLLISATQVMGNIAPLGQADSLSSKDVEDKVNKKTEFDDEITDKEAKSETTFYYDKYIVEESLSDKKIVQVVEELFFHKRKYNEATIDNLNEFYPPLSSSDQDDVQGRMVYDFYYKMYNLFIKYRDTYKVYLDLPLLMATLNLESTDAYVVFESNMDSRYRTDSVKDIPKNELDYYYDWTSSNYKISRNNSEHDMELLAQNMVSKQVKELCVDSNGKEVSEHFLRDNEIGTQTLFCEEGQTYKTEEKGFALDEEKYKEFLKQFLEKKYYLEGEHPVTTTNVPSNSNGNDSTGDNSNNSGNSSTGTTKLCALTIVGSKYYKTVFPATKDCNVPKFSENSWGLEPQFYNNIMSLIADAKAQGCDAKIISGHRTYEKQAYFYDCFQSKKCNNGNMAAVPGKSNHEFGIAADLSYVPKTTTCLNYYRDNAGKYGLEYPLWYHATHPENWHIEPIDIIVGKP